MMTRVHRALATALLAATLTAQPGGCSATPDEPQQPPPAATPAATAVFQVRAYDARGEGIRQPIVLVVTALQANMEPAHSFNDVTGEQRPNPVRLARATPYEHRMSMWPGVVAGSVSVFAFLKYGETLACWVEQDGQEVPGTRAEKSLRSVARNAEGSVSVACIFATL